MKKVFTFGDGGVLVNGSWLNKLVTLAQIKPNLGYVGTIKDGDLEGKEILYEIKLKGEILKELKGKLINLNKSEILEFDDFILDFSNFNEASVKVVLNAVNEALRGCSQLALAC